MIFTVAEDHAALSSVRNRPYRAPPSSFLIRMAMRISRARWFTFLRRVFHYQNGSRSDLGSNPFNSSTWMTLEFLALIIQLGIITFTLAISQKEKPVWPMRIWIVGYDIGCLLSLSLLYGRYRQLYSTQGDGFSLSDLEQQRSNEESRFSHLMNKCRTSLELFFAIWFVMGNVWPLMIRFLVYPVGDTNVDTNSELDANSNSTSANEEDPECCICLAKYREKEEVRQLPCSHLFHLNFKHIFLFLMISRTTLIYDVVDLAGSDFHRCELLVGNLKHTNIGMVAVNDGIVLRNHIYRILKNHFRGKPYYVDLLDLFNEVEFQTISGQMIDLITTLDGEEGEKDLSKYSLPLSLGYNMNMDSIDRAASDDQISSPPSWRYKQVDTNSELDANSNSTSANKEDPVSYNLSRNFELYSNFENLF
ncbi:hypothetical protein LWI29_010739 [Acer saccharum]|uniref:RING-type domain-containing protein n=1 Tax=Acer saccharum TaxID=4024 RepID=A0AA39SKH8_ACESA|nr:hypothetical protein LWI29_010739 [Acer saccharum]